MSGTAESVYLVQHVRDESDGSYKVIGIYSSRNAAESAVERLRGKPGFRDHPEGFSIDRYEIDRDCWPEGFGIA